jgi:hypothetical protein
MAFGNAINLGKKSNDENNHEVWDTKLDTSCFSNFISFNYLLVSVHLFFSSSSFKQECNDVF